MVARIAAVAVLAAGAASGQFYFGTVCTTDVPYATAANNSHKLAAFELSGIPGDTLTLVFQSSAGIWSSLGICGFDDIVWARPVMMYAGRNPGIDDGLDGDRHLVWEFPDTSSQAWQVYYRNFEYRMAPLPVSPSTADQLHPDVWADSAGVAHVVWEDYRNSKPTIYYRPCNENGVRGDTFRVSTSGTGACLSPSIEYFSDDTALAVVWYQVDSGSGTPYSIRRRCRKDGVWGSEVIMAQHLRPLRHPSLDRGSPGEGFGGGWEDSTSGNMDAHFEGGNGGGYHTASRSTAPVLSHLGTTWSYLFWNEDEDISGMADIAYDFYYFMTGWHGGTLRGVLPITEDVMHPSCLGATVVWTQGAGSQYKVMYGHFGYPIALAEGEGPMARGGLRVWPNPFWTRTAIISQPAAGSPDRVSIFDASGRCVRTLAWGARREARGVTWDGADAAGRTAPSGVYVVRSGGEEARVVKYQQTRHR
jgi:hypothetical protein